MIRLTATSDLEKQTDELREIVKEEKDKTSIDKITKPSIIEKVLSFDYSNLDSLDKSDLEKHMGALSQYLIFIHTYINQINIAKTCAQDEYKRALNLSILAVEKTKYKTITEKEMEAEQDPEVKELKDHVRKLNARIAVHKNLPDSIEILIQTIKKAYDAKIRERFTNYENQ